MEEPVNSIENALKLCGVTETTLTRAEKDMLDEKGYMVLPGAISSPTLEQMRDIFESAFVGECSAKVDRPQTGTRHVEFKFEDNPAFELIIVQPKVLAAAYDILGRPFKAGQLAGRDPLPGYGQQGLHSDWFARSPSEPFRVVTTIWLLDDFTAANGPTRVVPGSHRLLKVVPKNLADPAARHRDQVLITGKAGSVLVFNGHLWHSGTRNISSGSRRVLQCQFIGRGEIGYNLAPRELPDRLSPAARYILGG